MFRIATGTCWLCICLDGWIGQHKMDRWQRRWLPSQPSQKQSTITPIKSKVWSMIASLALLCHFGYSRDSVSIAVAAVACALVPLHLSPCVSLLRCSCSRCAFFRCSLPPRSCSHCNWAKYVHPPDARLVVPVPLWCGWSELFFTWPTTQLQLRSAVGRRGLLTPALPFLSRKKIKRKQTCPSLFGVGMNAVDPHSNLSCSFSTPIICLLFRD